MRRSWSDDDVERMVCVLGQCFTVPEALIKLSEEFNYHVTDDVLRGKLRRAGRGLPAEHLAKSRYTGAEPPDFEDAVTEPGRYIENSAPVAGVSRRDTEPVPVCVEPEPRRRIVAAVVFFGDLHAGIEDRRAVECAMRGSEEFLRPFASDERIVVQLGDLLDMEDFSSHPRRKNKWASADEEIEIGRWFLSEARARLGAARNEFVGGNHCSQRWEKYVSGSLRAVANIQRIADKLTLPGLLGLDELGWNYTRYNKSLQLGRCQVSHDFGSSGAGAIQKCLHGGYRAGSVFGHTHRLGVMYAGMDGDTFRMAANFGWLGRLDAIDYFNDRNAREQWCQGFGVAYLDSDGMLHAQAIPIVDGECVVNGRVIAA